MLQVGAYSEIGGRSKNEDCISGWHKGNKMCFLVADGLGGHGDGDLASRTAVDAIKTEWDGDVSAAAWQPLVTRAHESVQRLQTPSKQMKTTLVGLMMDEKQAVWAHVGDSRLYHFLDGSLVFQTQDHSAPQIAVLLGQITPEQIRTSKDRATIIKALGQPGEAPTAQVQTQPLEAGRHAFLLCSDGFWEYVLESEMEATLRSSHTAKQWLAKMRQKLQERAPTGNDNNSAIVIWKDIEKERDKP